MNPDTPSCALVSGASGGLGRALVAKFLEDPAIDRVIAVSRSPQPVEFAAGGDRLEWLLNDYEDQSLAELAKQLDAYRGAISRVCICNGVLHGDTFRPEKRLEDLSPAALHEVMQANTVVPMLWLKRLIDVLAGQQRCVVAVMSARVGSISDNRLGGWYSYRASKAALNMLLKTAAIEYGRRAANVKLVAFHPGTTDTDLSRPFQAGVPKDKLFSPQFVAGRLAAIMSEVPIDGQLAYLDWDNKVIEW